MSNQYHIVAIDNDYGYISNVTLYSSHDSKDEAEKALEDINLERTRSHVNKAKREKKNYQRYLKWASKANVECPNQYDGFHWVKQPGDPHHLAHVQEMPYSVVIQYNGKTVIPYHLVQIKNDEPLSLLDELTLPPEHYLEYHIVEPKKDN